MKKFSILFLILCMLSFILPVNARTIRPKGRRAGHSTTIVRFYPMPKPYFGEGMEIPNKNRLYSHDISEMRIKGTARTSSTTYRSYK